MIPTSLRKYGKGRGPRALGSSSIAAGGRQRRPRRDLLVRPRESWIQYVTGDGGLAPPTPPLPPFLRHLI